MTIDQLTNVVAQTMLISVAAERCVEISKNALSLGERITKTNVKAAVYHILALIFSLAIIYGSPMDLPKIVPGYVYGILASSGSSVWNTMFQLLSNMKVKTENNTTK